MTLSLLLANADQYCDNLLKQCKTFKTQCSPERITMSSCCDLTELTLSKAPSGVYQMMTNCTCGSPFNTVTADVYCDMNTTDGGWVVIQRNRKDSTLNFNRNWREYEAGFGDLNQDFWYGLEAIHCLTKSGQWEMRVDYQNKDMTWSNLHYTQFSVGNASEEYPLTIGGYTGTGISRFAKHNGMKFSTADNDNDINDGSNGSGNCAADFRSGWWHHNCDSINPNRQPPVVNGHVLFMEMKIRPNDCISY